MPLVLRGISAVKNRAARKGGVEICNKCGRSVAPKSGRFAKRIPDLNTVEERQALGRRHPTGDYVCADCEVWLSLRERQ